MCVCQVSGAVARPGQRGAESLRPARGGQTHLHAVCPLPQRAVCTGLGAHTQVRVFRMHVFYVLEIRLAERFKSVCKTWKYFGLNSHWGSALDLSCCAASQDESWPCFFPYHHCWVMILFRFRFFNDCSSFYLCMLSIGLILHNNYWKTLS